MDTAQPPPPFDPRLVRGLSVYQDVVLAGRTVRQGARDCRARWEAIAPHLPPAGAVLDVGSNFGWFGLKLCETLPGCVVASVEGDERSARVQRLVLESNRLERVCLLVRRADAGLVRRLVAAGQRFDAALCLSVLHWIRGHREILAALGAVTGRIFVEHPDPREAGSGVEAIRLAIGHIGPYLERLFPGRPVERLCEWPSHRGAPYPRQLWMVGEPAGWAAGPSPGLDAAALVDLAPSWPPRNWWLEQLARCVAADRDAVGPRGRVLFGPAGLARASDGLEETPLRELVRRARRVPRRGLFTPAAWCRHRLRRWGGQILRTLRLRS